MKVDPVALEQLTSGDGETFRQVFAIYAASINAREQKPEEWLRAMVAAPEYRVWTAQQDGRVLGFSILFVPPGEGYALLEYMAVAPEKRGAGFGGRLFQKTVAQALTPQGATLPVLLEVDADREAPSDRETRTRRLRFYRRLGCLTIAGLRYLMPLQGAGAAPEMDLMIYSPVPVAHLPVARVRGWLQSIYRDVYRFSPDDPRIAEMLRDLPDPVPVE
ncbi:MAG: GNAT family N-acetyltransferase [Polyangiaceae bacterium]